MAGNRRATQYKTAQARIYERILCGEPYDDILENIPTEKHRKEIMKRIKRYRTIESRDMNASLRAKTTGLTKSACLDLNRVFEKTMRCAA